MSGPPGLSENRCAHLMVKGVDGAEVAVFAIVVKAVANYKDVWDFKT